MNRFLERTHKHVMESISRYAPNTGLLTVDFTIDNSIGGLLYRLQPKNRNKAKYITILIISSEIKMSDHVAGMVYPLIDGVAAKKDRLIIIHSDGSSKDENDIDTFLSEEVDVFQPDYLRLPTSCENLKTSIDGIKYLELKNMLKKYFSGEISFIGPIAGKQSVNIETYKNICGVCEREIAVVSGIVFPKIQMPQWDNPFWQYYNRLLPLYALPCEYSQQIKREVNLLIKKDIDITPLIYYQNVEIEKSNWTVMCPHCKTVIDPYEADNKRMGYLYDFGGRMNGNLRYHSILIDAGQELINLLGEMSEPNPHAYHSGWLESKNIQP